MLLLVFVGLLCLSAIAQTPGQSATPASTQTKKGGASITCDGALDIVPSKAMSFVRKRRPNKADGKQQPQPADAKPQAKPASNSKSGQ